MGAQWPLNPLCRGTHGLTRDLADGRGSGDADVGEGYSAGPTRPGVAGSIPAVGIPRVVSSQSSVLVIHRDMGETRPEGYVCAAFDSQTRRTALLESED